MISLKKDFAFSIQFMVILRFIFGYYSEIIPTKFIRVLSKLYCVTFYVINSLYLLILMTHGYYTHSVINQFIGNIQFFILVVLSLYLKDRYFFDYFTHLKRIGCETRTPLPKLESPLSVFLVLTSVIINMLGLVFILSTYNYIWSPFLIFSIVTGTLVYLSRNLFLVPAIVIFDCSHSTVKTIKNILQTNLKNTITGNNRKRVSVERFLIQYKSVESNVRTTYKDLRIVMSIGILCIVSKLLIVIHSALFDGFTLDSSHIISWIIPLVQETLIVFTSAFLLEMTADEVDDIMSILTKQLINKDIDKKLHNALQDALDIVTVRPMVFELWPKFPMNMSLFVGFLNIICSYTICLLQFKY